jgi:hypothetical protein
VDKAIDIFQGLTNGHVQALFLFDIEFSYQKHVENVILAQWMVKGAYYIFLIIPALNTSITKERLDASQWQPTHALWCCIHWSTPILLLFR